MTKRRITCLGGMAGQNVPDTLDERRDACWIAGTTSVSASAPNRCDRVDLVQQRVWPAAARIAAD